MRMALANFLLSASIWLAASRTAPPTRFSRWVRLPPLTPLVLSKTSWTFFVSVIVVKVIFIKLIFNPIRTDINELNNLLFLLMSKPESIKVDPWTDFPRQPYSIISDDFVHDKLLTFKVNSKGDKSTFNLKLNVKADKAGRSLSDEVKLWFSLPGGHSIFSKVKSANYIKVHYDHGIIEKWDKKWNLYATLNCNKALENVSIRLGAGHKGKNCNSDNRLRVDFNNENKKSLTWYNRAVVNHNDFTMGTMFAVGITNKILLKNNLLFGYKINNNYQAFLRLENNTFRKEALDWKDWKAYFDQARIDVVSQIKDKNIKFGLEGILTHKTGCPLSEGLIVVQHHNKEKDWTTKARLSTNGDISLSVKYPSFLLKDIATCVLGVHGANLISDKRSFKFGLQLECNV